LVLHYLNDILCKNYNYMFVFAKVIPKTLLVPFFSGHGVLRSLASSLFNLCAQQSFSTISLQVFFGLPVGLVPSTSYSIHFFTQSLFSFRSTCQYHRNLFCCSTFTWNTILLLNATYSFDHSHLCPLKCHLIFVSYRPGLIVCTMQLPNQTI